MLRNLGWTCLLTVLVICVGSIYANGPIAFSMPNSLLLFGRHNELRIARPDRSEAIKPPTEVAANHGYFAYPSLSPRGDIVAWGFARESRKANSRHPVRFVLGVFSLAEANWRTFGDFDNIGATTFSRDGSKIAFVAEQEHKKNLLIFDVGKETMTSGPYPQGMPESGALSWSPDSKQITGEIQRGGKAPLIVVLDLDTGNVRPLGEGLNPSWSPKGDWIAYFDPSGAECVLVHPDGTGRKVLRKLNQSAVSYRRFGWGSPVWSTDGTQMLLDEMKGDGDHSDTVLVDTQSGRVSTKARNGLPVFGWATEPK